MNFLVFIAGLVGLLAGGFKGLLIGGLVGYGISRILPHLLIKAATGKLAQVQSRFFDAVFAVAGAMSKADGRVSADEIAAVEAMFERMRLSPAARESAKAAFNRGKQADFDVDAEVASFAAASRGQRLLHQMFLQVLLTTLASDGQVHPAEHAMLLRVARGLGLSEAEVMALEAMLRGAQPGGGSQSRTPRPDALEDAYRVLGVAPSASDAELKRAYRRQISEHHPDKLAGKGLPESMREMAEQQTRAITAAYDLIQKARKAA